jgi:NRAMP (natural resistance-associated macrophage protein)-like metal ion transporter
MHKKKNSKAKDIEPGMVVEATRGDLGEEDVSKPKVAEVVEGEQGDVEKLVVEKGVIFRKKLEIPAARVKAVEPEPEKEERQGKVTVKVSKEEAGALKSVGNEELTPESQDDVLDTVERKVPTAEGVREMEASNVVEQQEHEEPQSLGEAVENLEEEEEKQPQPPATRGGFGHFLRTLGPGFLSGMAGNDSTAVATYAVDGATAGYGHLWLLLLSTPLYQAVQFACAKIGRITQKGLAEILREYYGRWVAILASLVLIIANVALIAGNLVAIGSGLELITGISWIWFVVPVAIFLWYITVYRNFETLKKIFIVMSLAFVTYFITAIFSGAHWTTVLINTFVPRVSLNFASISAAVALLGATISPYTIFWQVQGEKEQKRPGSTRQRIRSAALDIATGVISGNLVAYFIIITTAATLFTHHQSINTAADAARALEPLLGPFAKYMFAIGLIGSGLIAIPILLASTSYGVAGTFGWPAGLSKKPWQNEGFYLILTGAMIVSLALTLARINPIQLIFYANVLVGVLAPILVIYILLVGNNRKIMRGKRLSLFNNVFLVLTTLVMVAAATLFFYSLLTGRGS